MKAAGDHPPGSVRLALGTQVVRIEPKHVVLKDDAGKETDLPNDVVFTMLGREAPLEFFRRSGIPIRGEWTAATWVAFAAFFLFCVFLYNWKADGDGQPLLPEARPLPVQRRRPLAARRRATLAGTLAISLRTRLLLLARLLPRRCSSSASGGSAGARRPTSRRRP